MREFDDDDVAASPYSRKVGERLRVIRRQKRLSLQEVEATSQEEFKASVLDAYERGERAISVPRLERLAKFYNVPVDQLLPREDVTAPGEAETQNSHKLAVDLLKLTQLTGQPFLPVFETKPGHFDYDVVFASIEFERDEAGQISRNSRIYS